MKTFISTTKLAMTMVAILTISIFTSCSSSQEGMSLSEFSAENYPDSDVWVINDIRPLSHNSFDPLREALSDLYEKDSSRRISLVFPNIIHFPRFAFFHNGVRYTIIKSNTTQVERFVPYSLICSISAPKSNNIPYLLHNDSLTNVSMPQAKKMTENSFHMDRSLESVNVQNVRSIKEGAFYLCISLSSIELPMAQRICASAFASCINLEHISLPQVTTLEYNAFEACVRLTDISLPKCVEIGENAFGGIGQSAPSNTTKSIEIATADNAKIKTIHKDAFYKTRTDNIILTVGEANRQYVDNNTLTVGDTSLTFKEIKITD